MKPSTSTSFPDMADRAKPAFFIQDQVVPVPFFQIVTGYAGHHSIREPDPLGLHLAHGGIKSPLAGRQIFFHDRVRCGKIALHGAEYRILCQRSIVASDAAIPIPSCFHKIAMVLDLFGDRRRGNEKNDQEYGERKRRVHFHGIPPALKNRLTSICLSIHQFTL